MGTPWRMRLLARCTAPLDEISRAAQLLLEVSELKLGRTGDQAAENSAFSSRTGGRRC